MDSDDTIMLFKTWLALGDDAFLGAGFPRNSAMTIKYGKWFQNIVNAQSAFEHRDGIMKRKIGVNVDSMFDLGWSEVRIQASNGKTTISPRSGDGVSKGDGPGKSTEQGAGLYSPNSLTGDNREYLHEREGFDFLEDASPQTSSACGVGERESLISSVGFGSKEIKSEESKGSGSAPSSLSLTIHSDSESESDKKRTATKGPVGSTTISGSKVVVKREPVVKISTKVLPGLKYDVFMNIRSDLGRWTLHVSTEIDGKKLKPIVDKWNSMERVSTYPTEIGSAIDVTSRWSDYQLVEVRAVNSSRSYPLPSFNLAAIPWLK